MRVGYKDRSAISRIESGQRDVSQMKIVSLATALNVSITWLLGFSEKYITDDMDEIDKKIVDNSMKLNKENKKDVLRYIQFLSEK